MNNIKKNITRDEILRLIYLKKELNFILLKSIVTNRQAKNNIRALASYKIQRMHLYKSRQNNVCILTGKIGGVYKITNTSRQMLNKLLQKGELNLIKSNNNK